MFILNYNFHLFWSGIAGSHGSSIFSLLKYLLTVSLVGAPTFIPTNSVVGLFFLLYYLLFVDFLMVATLTGVSLITTSLWF